MCASVAVVVAVVVVDAVCHREKFFRAGKRGSKMNVSFLTQNRDPFGCLLCSFFAWQSLLLLDESHHQPNCVQGKSKKNSLLLGGGGYRSVCIH